MPSSSSRFECRSMFDRFVVLPRVSLIVCEMPAGPLVIGSVIWFPRLTPLRLSSFAESCFSSEFLGGIDLPRSLSGFCKSDLEDWRRIKISF
jgi:hypothetical protein